MINSALTTYVPLLHAGIRLSGGIQHTVPWFDWNRSSKAQLAHGRLRVRNAMENVDFLTKDVFGAPANGTSTGLHYKTIDMR